MQVSTSFAQFMHLSMLVICFVTYAHKYLIVYWLVNLCQILLVDDQIQSGRT